MYRFTTRKVPQKPEPKKKKTLEEAVIDIKKQLTHDYLDKLKRQKQEESSQLEDEVMAMTHGPNWRDKDVA